CAQDWSRAAAGQTGAAGASRGRGASPHRRSAGELPSAEFLCPCGLPERHLCATAVCPAPRLWFGAGATPGGRSASQSDHAELKGLHAGAERGRVGVATITPMPLSAPAAPASPRFLKIALVLGLLTAIGPFAI